MAASNNGKCVMDGAGASGELGMLRVWRALFSEFYGRVRGLEDFRFLLGMEDGDALSALGLSGSAWAAERLDALRAMLV